MKNPIIIEGAVDSELDVLIGSFKPRKIIDMAGYRLYCEMSGMENVALLRTEVGAVNAAAANALVCAEFNPRALISQGTAGAHAISLRTGDVVIGTEIIRLGAYKSPSTEMGIAPEKWSMLGFDGSPDECVRLFSDKALVALAADAARDMGMTAETRPCAVCGTIGSGDVWNCESEMIDMLNKRYGTACEEMETFAAAQVCARFGVPFLSLRIISNNERLGEKYAPDVAANLQKLARDVALNINSTRI